MKKVKVLCVGAGHMGASHARAYEAIEGFEICGIVTRSEKSRRALNADLGASYFCLLYTSPSPRDLSTSRMPSSA